MHDRGAYTIFVTNGLSNRHTSLLIRVLEDENLGQVNSQSVGEKNGDVSMNLSIHPATQARVEEYLLATSSASSG